MAEAGIDVDNVANSTSESWDVIHIQGGIFGGERQESKGTLVIEDDHSVVFREHNRITLENLRWVSSREDVLIISYYGGETGTVDYQFLSMNSPNIQKCFARLKELMSLKFTQNATVSADYDADAIKEVVGIINNQPSFMKILGVKIRSAQLAQQPSSSTFLVIGDQECLCLLDTSTSQPVHQVLFHGESGPYSVDQIKLFHGSISILTETEDFIFDADQELLHFGRKMHSVCKRFFADPVEMVSYVKKTERRHHRAAVGDELARQRVEAERFMYNQGEGDKLASGRAEAESMSLEQRNVYSQGEFVGLGVVSRLISQMDTALNTFKNEEDVQNYWITLEYDIKEAIGSGEIPETEHQSGGLDPNNEDHLEKCFSDIEDQFREKELTKAVSRLNACRDLFEDSKIRGISSLFAREDLDLLKALYMKSLMS